MTVAKKLNPEEPETAKAETAKLEIMFAMQYELSKRTGIDHQALNDEERIQWILNYARGLQQEVAELIDSVPWKWWAHYQKMDLQNARVELIDVFHFLISIAQVLGMSAEDFFQVYCKKNKINHCRQDSGYLQKDGDDCRSI